MSTRPTRAVIYCRISQDRNGERLGVTRQREDCEKLAAQLGWQIAEILIENDTSAYSGKPRAKYDRLLAGLGDGTYDGVVAWHTDRLHRSPVELEGFIDVLDKARAPVATVRAGHIDLTTPSGKMIARALGVMARFESEHKSDRARRKALELAEAGAVASGGTRGWGYTRDMHVVPEEADLIRESARRILAGHSRGSVAKWLNEAGKTSPAGKTWRPTTLARSLTSARLAGWRSHHPGATPSERRLGSPFVAKGSWEPILTREMVERLRAILANPSRRKGGPDSVYLLTGLLRCGGDSGCGHGLAGAAKEGKRRYRCVSVPIGKGCGKRQIVADESECEIVAQVASVLGKPVSDRLAMRERTANEAGVAKLLASIRDDDETLIQLGQDLDDRLITRAEWSERRPRIEARRNHARSELAELESIVALPDAFVGQGEDGFAVAWKDADLETRRVVLRSLIEYIDVLPGTPGRNVFEPDRLEVKWRV